MGSLTAPSRSLRSVDLMMDDEPKEPEIEVYKGKYYQVVDRITGIMYWPLLPMSLMYRYTLPNMKIKRTGRRSLTWGLAVVVIYIFILSFLIIWVEDDFFTVNQYSHTLLGLVINAPLIALPQLLQHLSILDPAQPYT